MAHNWMIDMFNMVVLPTISNASGNEMYSGTSVLLMPKTLVSHCICTSCLLNRDNMLRSLDMASSSASDVSSAIGIVGASQLAYHDQCKPKQMKKLVKQ